MKTRRITAAQTKMKMGRKQKRVMKRAKKMMKTMPIMKWKMMQLIWK
jgi:hypothetical protein